MTVCILLYSQGITSKEWQTELKNSVNMSTCIYNLDYFLLLLKCLKFIYASNCI